MSDPFSEGDIAKTIAHPLMVALGAALAWLTVGRSPALRFSRSPAELRSWLFLSCYRRFFGILGAGGDPAGSPECESYVKLRESPAKGTCRRVFMPAG
jgi:hypothetical protein